MTDAGEIARFHDRCSELMRELLDALRGPACGTLSAADLTEPELEIAVERLAAAVRGALEQTHPSPRAGRI
ncbi:MAG: hypothetical protein ACRDLY_15745 [Thermoleophilaceae bacterium]